jgi:ATP-dependent Lhr-like helicase
VVEVRIAGEAMLAVAEDIPRLRDGLGIPVPPGVAASFTELLPIPSMILCCGGPERTGPSSSPRSPDGMDWGERSLSPAATSWTLGSLAAGSFLDMPGDAANERRQYCHSQVLALIKRRTLALLRKASSQLSRSPLPASSRSGRDRLGQPRRRRRVGAIEQLSAIRFRECRGVDDLAG